MKKTYIKPELTQEVVIEQYILAGTDEGVQTGNSLGDEYNEGDVSYTNWVNVLWDED